MTRVIDFEGTQMALSKKQNLATAEENSRLQREVGQLKREKAIMEEQTAESGSSSLVEINQQLIERLAEAEERLKAVEVENRDFATMFVEVQDQYQMLSSLYVASQRLHATLDQSEVMKIVVEILIELVGAEEFGIMLLDRKKKTLELVAGEGMKERLPAKSLPAGEGILGEVALSAEPFFFKRESTSELESNLPLAAIPLNINEEAVGVIVIYRLLSQKNGFSSTDHQLLQLLAVHAATALVSARSHNATDRRLKTIEGFLQLTKSQ